MLASRVRRESGNFPVLVSGWTLLGAAMLGHMVMGAMADTERRRLLWRLRTDVQQVQAEVAQINEQTNLLLTVQEVRPLTADEHMQERRLHQQAEYLRLRLRALAREFRDLQHID